MNPVGQPDLSFRGSAARNHSPPPHPARDRGIYRRIPCDRRERANPLGCVRGRRNNAETPANGRGFQLHRPRVCTADRVRQEPVRAGGHRVSQPRIHSPGRGATVQASTPAGASELAATTAESLANGARLHLQTSRRRAAHSDATAPVRAGGHRVFQPRFQSPWRASPASYWAGEPAAGTAESPANCARLQLHLGFWIPATRHSLARGRTGPRGRTSRRPSPLRILSGNLVGADAPVLGTPHAVGPPSPRRRTLRFSSGEFIRSRGRAALYWFRFATGIIRRAGSRRSQPRVAIPFSRSPVLPFTPTAPPRRHP